MDVYPSERPRGALDPCVCNPDNCLSHGARVLASRVALLNSPLFVFFYHDCVVILSAHLPQCERAP